MFFYLPLIDQSTVTSVLKIGRKLFQNLKSIKPGEPKSGPPGSFIGGRLFGLWDRLRHKLKLQAHLIVNSVHSRVSGVKRSKTVHCFNRARQDQRPSVAVRFPLAPGRGPASRGGKSRQESGLKCRGNKSDWSALPGHRRRRA